MTSPLRSSTPLLNGIGHTRPTSPVSSSPLRHTVAITSGGNTYSTSNVRSRDVSREREREPLDYTDLEGTSIDSMIDSNSLSYIEHPH
jgi:hypothetical protein